MLVVIKDLRFSGEQSRPSGTRTIQRRPGDRSQDPQTTRRRWPGRRL